MFRKTQLLLGTNVVSVVGCLLLVWLSSHNSGVISPPPKKNSTVHSCFVDMFDHYLKIMWNQFIYSSRREGGDFFP